MDCVVFSVEILFYTRCWETNFSLTYFRLADILSVLQKNTRPTPMHKNTKKGCTEHRECTIFNGNFNSEMAYLVGGLYSCYRRRRRSLQLYSLFSTLHLFKWPVIVNAIKMYSFAFCSGFIIVLLVRLALVHYMQIKLWRMRYVFQVNFFPFT